MRSILLSLLFISATAAFAQHNLITLEDIWRDGTFTAKSVPGFNALPDGERYTELIEEGSAHIIRVKTLRDGKEARVLYKGSLPVDDYALSADGRRMLLLTESQNIYRRSILHHVYVLDVSTGKTSLLDSAKVLHAGFSPDGNKVAFVKDNNLFYKDLLTNKVTAITTDGLPNHIINGNCDWVYEEEFEFTQAYQWSPDSKYIAYYRFDESAVPEYTMTVYDSLYPTPYKYKYPKAGERNSTVTIRAYNMADGKTSLLNILKPAEDADIYIPRIKWAAASSLCIYKLNRHQNHLNLLLADLSKNTITSIYDEKNAAFIEIGDNLRFLQDGKSMVFTSEVDGWNHLYVWEWATQRLTKLTKGDFDVDALIDVNEGAKTVYYTAAQASPLQRQLYAVGYSGEVTRCLTPDSGTHAITPIEGAKYFLDRYSRLNVPPVYRLIDAQGKLVRTLEDNARLAARMKEYALGKMEFTQVKGDSGVLLNAWRILPPGFDATKKYPVLMYQYSGPASQEVADRFPLRDYFWHQMLAQKGYIIYCVDGTGTGFRGEAFRKKTYLQLGRYESDDQIAAARSIAALPYVDKGRIGIWGWSFGGFMSATCIMKGADVFKMAVAVAPVTNWRYYDNVYTERYMRKPAENAAGYDANAPEKMAARLKGPFLLIHGTGDDNVHFQNSVSLVNNLIKEGKAYDSEYYPNRAHGISGGGTRLHLYRRMTDFILTNL